MSNLPIMQEIEIMEKMFELEQRKAKAMKESSILPAHFRNIGDIIVLNEMSRNLHIPVILLAQQLYIVKGKVGYTGQFSTALLNKAVELGKLEDWYFEKKEDGVRVIGIKKGKKIEGPWIDKELVKKNGWMSNPHWINNFELMASYRAASWFCRLYLPDMLMGMHEIEEIIDGEVDNEVKIEPIQNDNNVINPLSLVKEREEEIKATEAIKEQEKITQKSFAKLYGSLEKEQRVKYMSYMKGVDLSKLNEEELANLYKEVKQHVGA